MNALVASATISVRLISRVEGPEYAGAEATAPDLVWLHVPPELLYVLC